MRLVGMALGAALMVLICLGIGNRAGLEENFVI